MQVTVESNEELLEEKAYFQAILDEVESGTAILLEHQDVWDSIEQYTE